jgi:hypothetical protein
MKANMECTHMLVPVPFVAKKGKGRRRKRNLAAR